MCSQLVSQNTALLRKRSIKGKKNNFGVYIIMLGKAHQMNIGIGTCTVKNLFNVKIHECTHFYLSWKI